MSRRQDPWSRPKDEVRAEVLADVRAGINAEIRATARASNWSPSGIYARIAAGKAPAVREGRKLLLTPEGAANFLGVSIDRPTA